MKAAEIECWALKIIEFIKANHKVEDSRVELKTTWLENKSSIAIARRIAGHANQAYGEPIMWLIGVDEKSGVVGAPSVEISNWYKSIESCFDGYAPPVTDVKIESDGNLLTALVFDTQRAPFVVKVEESKTVTFEVPWRSETSVRTARRNELLKILVPIQRLPLVEVLEGILTYEPSTDDPLKFRMQAYFKVYMTPRIEGLRALPFHKASISVASEGLSEIVLRKVGLAPYKNIRGFIGRMEQFQSVLVEESENELVLAGPGMVEVMAIGDYMAKEENGNVLKAVISLSEAGSDGSAVVESLLDRVEHEDHKFLWRVAGTDVNELVVRMDHRHLF